MSQVLERPSATKAFALADDELVGASKAEQYDSDESWVQAKQLHSMCQVYAQAYNHTMLKRLENEKPEFYEENNLDKTELIAHLTNNMCLPYSKLKAKAFRDRTVQLKEKEHLQEQIRRLNNGGDRFHPYF